MFKNIPYRKTILIGFLMVFALILMGSNDIDKGTYTIYLGSLDSNWSSTTDTTNCTTDQRRYGLVIHSITFHPGATDDECIIYNGTSTSDTLTFRVTCADSYDDRIKYYPPDVRRHLYLDYDNGTYSSGSFVIIELWEE